jgi:acetyl esterase/lipase
MSLVNEMKRVRRILEKLPAPGDSSLENMRANGEKMALLSKLPVGCKEEADNLAGVPGTRIRPDNALPGARILFLHGGGFLFGSPRTHRLVGARLALASGAVVHLPEYRLAPEHPFPAAVEDAKAAWGGLLDLGANPSRTAVFGDSSGGGLAVSMCVSLKDEGKKPLPCAIMVASPWVDLTCSAESHTSNESADPIIQTAHIRKWRWSYLDSTPATHPLASPVFADLSGLPEMYIQVGSEEVLLDDSKNLHKKALADGVPVRLEVWEGMFHGWHAYYSMLGDARRAIKALGDFYRKKIK